MAQSQPVPKPVKGILQPPCPTCGHPMWMFRLSQIDDDHDLRTFKCQVCEFTESMIVQFK